MTRATLDSWCSCGVRGTAVHMVGECPRTGAPASPPPAATATERPPLEFCCSICKEPHGDVTCVAALIPALHEARAALDALRGRCEELAKEWAALHGQSGRRESVYQRCARDLRALASVERGAPPQGGES